MKNSPTDPTSSQLGVCDWVLTGLYEPIGYKSLLLKASQTHVCSQVKRGVGMVLTAVSLLTPVHTLIHSITDSSRGDAGTVITDKVRCGTGGFYGG